MKWTLPKINIASYKKGAANYTPQHLNSIDYDLMFYSEITNLQIELLAPFIILT